LWEIGVVGGGGWLPDYPAADQNHVNGIALPYAVYRGEFFRVGDGAGPRGLFVDMPWLELNVGLDASFPVDSDDNDARRGMDDLDYLLEAGPKLIGKLLADDPVNELDLSLAARVVLSTDFKGIEYQGLTVNPAITYRRNDLFDTDLRAIAAVGATFGFDGFNDYFYEVRPADVRPDRPRHRADPGYVGSEVTLGLSWSVTERIHIFGGTQIGLWTGSANDDSPLYRDEVTYAVGGGLRWTFFVSDRKVLR
jgi:outer membrane scaffolding protein for murein synthesis (MipA/OmpV family)